MLIFLCFSLVAAYPHQALFPSTPVWFAPDPALSSPIVAAYYPDWSASQLPPEILDFTKFDWIDFAFAVPDPVTYSPTFLQYNSQSILRRLVTIAHLKRKKVKLSIGGWTGSAHFSQAVSPQNRIPFARNILQLYNKFNLDGIDIDWEYPGEQGAPGNIYSPADCANFLAFLQILRSLLPPQAYITAATQVWPFMDATGEHMKDISPFAHVLDWVLLMNYDVWGSSSTPGPNAPLSDACHNSSQPDANAQAAIASWTAAGFPLQKIMLGLPAYGYVSSSEALSLRTRRQEPPSLDRAPISAHPPVPLVVLSEAGSAQSGQIQFRALVAQGALIRNKPGVKPDFVGARGFERHWDVCSNTPFLRSTASQQIITYDDPESLEIKAAFAKKSGILGVNMWDAHGDTVDWDLTNGIRRGLGVDGELIPTFIP